MRANSKLKNTGLFKFLQSEAELPIELLEKLLSLFEKLEYKRGEHLLLKGDIEKRISYMEKGIVHQYRIKNKKPTTINIALPGMIFNSFTSYSLGMPSQQQQTAISDVTVYCISKEIVNNLIKSNHTFCYLYLKKQEQIHLERELRWRIIMNKAAHLRLRYFIEHDKKAEYFLKHVPNKLVANYLNLSPETLSREKNRYFKERKVS